MESVITFIGKNISACLSEISREFKMKGASVGQEQWLSDIALDLPFTGLDIVLAQECAKEVIAQASIDCYAQHRLGRKKKLLIADMDSTMIIGETMDDLALESSFQSEIVTITQLSVAGSINFAEGLKRRVALLKGLNQAVLDKVREKMVISPGAATLVNTMRAHGAKAALVSGSFTCFANVIGQKLCFDLVLANELYLSNGTITGSVKEPVLDSQAKATILLEMAKEFSLSLQECAAIGDGSNDIPMLKEAGLGCAYYGKPLVKEFIKCQINHADLSGLLYYQGYRQDEFSR